MKPSVGFVFVTYSLPRQTLNLCRRLGELFGDPPIAIHHDFSQCDLETTKFPPFVHFVKQWRRTSWGSMSVVDAQISALRLLYEKADPDWCTNLSSTDYPIQSGENILADLHNSSADAFLDLRIVRDHGQPYVNEGLGELAFNHPRYSQGAWNRYVAIPLMTPALARRARTPVEAWVLRSPWLIKRATPFNGSIECFGGDAWFTINRRVAQFVLAETPFRQTLHRHFRSRSTPEESFLHTLLGNTPGFRIANDCLRYTDWRGCYAHPRTLGHDDLPRLIASPKHFARKFHDDPNMFAAIDAAVATKPGGELSYLLKTTRTVSGTGNAEPHRRSDDTRPVTKLSA